MHEARWALRRGWPTVEVGSPIRAAKRNSDECRRWRRSRRVPVLGRLLPSAVGRYLGDVATQGNWWIEWIRT